MSSTSLCARELETIYRRSGYLVLRRARQILGNEHDAQEVLQEVFVSLLERPEQFAGKSKVTSFLYSVTTHRCFNKLRNARNRERILKQHQGEEHGIEPRADAWILVREIVSQLPEQQALVLVYHYGDGMTQDEVAEVMGCSRRHIVNLLARLSTAIQKMEEIV